MSGEEVALEEMHSAEDEAASPNEPLISRQSEEQEQHDGSDGGRPAHGTTTITLRTAGGVIWLLTLSAGLSGLLFGYDTGVISSTLVSIGTDLSHRPLTTADKSLVTAITSLFALLSSPWVGYLADKYGRRFVIFVACVLFIFGALGQAFSAYIWQMAIGRALVGAAVGMASCATPLYITELAPANLRGRLVTIQSLFITGGQVVAYLIGWAFAAAPGGWRWMVGLGAVPAIVQLFLITLMLETPRYLAKAGKEAKAQSVLRKVYGGLSEREREMTIQRVLDDIETEIAEEYKGDIGSSTHSTAFLTTLKHLVSIPGNLRALSIACMLQGLQQLCGFNSLMYFSATIFALVGFVNPIATSLTVAGTNCFFTVIAFAFIDTVGRRNILLRSVPFMVLGLLACSLCFHLIGAFTTTDALWTKTESTNSAWPSVLVASMLVYVAAYAIGLGCVPWQQSELFPLRVRSLGSGIATATNWSSNFVIGISFLPMMEFLGPSTTFGLYAAVCVFGWVAIWRIYPETAGLELEAVGELLANGWGVKASIERFGARKEGRGDGGGG